MPTRRRFVQASAAAAALSSAANAAKTEPTLANASVYTRLGVNPVINGMGTVTVLGGSLMPPEVVRAMEEASRHFIHLPELQKKAGERLAELCSVPAAMVTTGAAGAITCATAACVTRGSRRRLAMLPDTDGLPNEVIQQKAHHSGYEAQIRLTGAKIIEVETSEELERAIGPRTAMLFYLNKAENHGKIQRKQFLEIAKRHKVPAFNDAAADVPPSRRLGSIVEEGFDLVAFSGGKGIRGPQASGLLLGRKDLIEAAQQSISPAGGIGRGMKVGKEEIIGLVAAVERFLKFDHEAEARMLDARVAEMIKLLSGVKDVETSREVPEIANEVPHCRIRWTGKKTGKQVHAELLNGDPPIATLLQGERSILVSVWMMRGNEHRTAARRLKEILESA
jgi:L-seryl-tRNA(Ser) seleniumtransferase